MGVVQQGGQCQYCGRTGPIEVRQPDDGIRACYTCWKYNPDIIYSNGEIDYASDRKRGTIIVAAAKRRQPEVRFGNIVTRLLVWVISLFSAGASLARSRARKSAPGIYSEMAEPINHPYRSPAEPLEELQPEPPKPIKPKRQWKLNMTWNYDLPDTLFGILGFGLLFGLVGTLGYCFYHGAIKADNRVDYCYVGYSNWKEKATDREEDKKKADAEGNVLREKYSLDGHVPWGHDRPLAKYDNLQDALKAAEILQCPVK